MVTDSPVGVTPSICQALAGLQDLMDHHLHLANVRRVGEPPVGIESVSGPPQSKRLGRYPTLQVKQQGGQVAL